ncbi:MAG: HD domain-containing protein [Gammaproteobacteria bacterium]|nr:HD domain-containing protein [Gammaproteobacteria bacterium]
MGYQRIKKGELKVGDILPWHVYTESGKLLLGKGVEIEGQHQIDMLIRLGFRTDAVKPNRLSLLTEKEIDNPFAFAEEVLEHLKNILRNLTLPGSDANERLQYSVILIIKLCREFPDAMLAVVHLFDEKPYSVTHSFHTAILTSMLCQKMELSDMVERQYVAAALTANLGMLDLQDTLENQKTELTEEQRQRIHEHPALSSKILERYVTEDKDIITIVQQHHENLDGSGYPQGLSGDQITQGSRIVAVADRYSSMITQHQYAKKNTAMAVLKKLYVEKGSALDEEICLLLINVLGVFPPGTYVELKNGESAIVTFRARHGDQHWPQVSSFRGVDGGTYINPLHRDSNRPEYKINKMFLSEQMPFTYSSIWGYE